MNRWYPKALEAFANKQLDWDTDDIRVVLIKSAYTFDEADAFVADLVAHDNGRSGTVTGRTILDGGVLDANDVAVIATAAIESSALVLFVHTGNDATAQLLIYIDDVDDDALPTTPEAAQAIVIVWDNGAGRIATL